MWYNMASHLRLIGKEERSALSGNLIWLLSHASDISSSTSYIQITAGKRMTFKLESQVHVFPLPQVIEKSITIKESQNNCYGCNPMILGNNLHWMFKSKYKGRDENFESAVSLKSTWCETVHFFLRFGDVLDIEKHLKFNTGWESTILVAFAQK